MQQSAVEAQRQVQNVIGRAIMEGNILYLIKWAGIFANKASWVRVSEYCAIQFEIVQNADKYLRQTGEVYVNQTLAAINHAVCEYDKQMKQQPQGAIKHNKEKQSKTNDFDIVDYHILQPLGNQLVKLHTENSKHIEEKEYMKFIQKHLQAHVKGDQQSELIIPSDHIEWHSL